MVVVWCDLTAAFFRSSAFFRYLRSGSPLALGNKHIDQLKEQCPVGALTLDALVPMQDQMLFKLRTYWVPRFIASTPRIGLIRGALYSWLPKFCHG